MKKSDAIQYILEELIKISSNLENNYPSVKKLNYLHSSAINLMDVIEAQIKMEPPVTLVFYGGNELNNHAYQVNKWDNEENNHDKKE